MHVLCHTCLVVIDQDVADTLATALVLRVTPHLAGSVDALAVRGMILPVVDI